MINAQEYAKALFLITEEEGETEAAMENTRLVKAVFDENPAYAPLLDTPAIPKEEKLALIDEAFSAVGENLKNLIKILCERHSVYVYPKVFSAYSALYDESRGIERVIAISAVEMKEEQIAALKAKLSAITGKTIIIKNDVDPSILGGIKLRYSGIQLDGSVKTRLDGFEEKLKSLVI